MPDEPSQNPVFPDSKLNARAAELKQILLKSRMKTERPVKVDPDSIDELIRQNSGGMVMATAAAATDQETGNGLVDRVLKRVVHSPIHAPPPTASTSAAAAAA